MNKKKIILILLSGILFGISFPPFSTNLIPFFALVPYLFLIYNQKSIWKTFRVTYFTFFIASLIALYWTAGITHMRDPYLIFAGVALYFWQPAFFTDNRFYSYHAHVQTWCSTKRGCFLLLVHRYPDQGRYQEYYYF